MISEKIKEFKLKRNSNKENKFKNYIIKISLVIASLFAINFLINGIFNVNIMSIVANKLFSSTPLEVRNVEFKSEGYDDGVEGSWYINKSAKWTSDTTARITFDVDTIIKARGEHKDVILVIDTSGSMHGEKIEKVKSDTIELINYLLEDVNNRVAIVTFSNTSNILSNFSNDREELISKIETIIDGGETNYNAALKNVDLVMEGYTKEENKDVVTLFLTDGYPNIDTPNQIGTYNVLKTKYPYMSINGVQYEMGTNILNEIKEISDYQYIASVNTLKEVLFEISTSPEVYEYFETIDYINSDYFYVNNVNDIKVSIGEVKLEEENGLQKISWNLGKYTYFTGKKATMSINVTLKEDYVGVRGLYQTNSKVVIKLKLPDLTEEKVESTDAPVLKSYYNVIYDTNPPIGCDIKEVTEEEHFVYENIKKKNNELTCDGYLFKGWEVVEDVTKVNDEVFVMPDHDVNIRGTWTKQSIFKSMEGTIRGKMTLYKEVKKAYEEGRGAALYTGNGSDTFKNNVYYYNGDAGATNNHVIFGGFCWKIVRTTDTGGVKLLYNGVPNEEGTCNNTGTDSQIGTSAFNSNYNSPAYVGYMYNEASATNYSYKAKDGSRFKVFNSNEVSSTNYYYGDTVEYDGSNYVLKNNNGSEVTQKLWSDNYSTLTGYYTCRSETKTSCSTVYYVAAGTSSTQYTITLDSGKTMEDVNKMVLGSSIIENGDGTYTLNNPITITRSDWYKDYDTYKNYYICSDQVSTTCSDMYSISSSSNYNYNYYSSLRKKYLYGNTFTYDKTTKTYKLSDTKEIWDWKVDYNQINNNHYTCFNETGECEELSYVYYADDSFTGYINLVEGKSVEDALNEMLWDDDVNSKDSTIKETIDKWYEDNMTEYTDMLEDTVFCNDRSIDELNGWNPNEGDVTSYLEFGANGRHSGSYDLTCSNKNDSFTMSESIGNGKLKYPVGLLTRDEASLVGNKQMNTGQVYWLGSPYWFSTGYAYEFYVIASGDLVGHYVNGSYGLRPSLSLKPDTTYSSGDGSVSNPFIILTD